MRSIALALGASIVLAHLTGCAGSADRAPAESPSTGMQRPAAYGGGRAQNESTIARDREVDVVENAYKQKAADEPAPPPAYAPPGAPSPSPAQPPSGQVTASTPTTTVDKPPKAEPAKEAAPAREFVIYTARFVMAVYQVDQGIAAIEKIARDHGGYLSVKKDREITVRVPRQRFEQAVGAVDKVGDVLHRDIMAEDVTDEHVDLEIRIRNARAMQHQLTALLTRANVKEALEIEKELHRVTEELERLEGKMKLLNAKIAFSTISVVFEPRGTTLTTQRPRLPFPWLSALNLPTLLQLNEDK